MGFLLTAFFLSLISTGSSVLSQSNLLESVKSNPKEAEELCTEFKRLNSKGISASSKETLETISEQRNISKVNAEIVTTYVRGLHCPEVF